MSWFKDWLYEVGLTRDKVEPLPPRPRLPDTLHEYVRIGTAGIGSIAESLDDPPSIGAGRHFVRIRSPEDIEIDGREIETLIDFLQDHQERSGYYDD